MIILRTGLEIGKEKPIRINCNVGCNSISDYECERNKLLKLKEESVLPDMMMDLSLIELEHPLYNIIRDELQLPFGTVLSYWCFNKETGLQWSCIRNKFVQLCKEGLSFVTIHFTADIDLLEKANGTRLIPMTSRGGGITLYDVQKNKRKKNIFREHIDELASIAKDYNIVVSLGTTFRPGTIVDACDDIHIEETKRQLEICKYLQEKGVQVMIENVGHITLNKLKQHRKLLTQFNAPIMPLGPLPTDAAIGQDHIANAIGAAYSASLGIAQIINCVTRHEHSLSEITFEATFEAIRSARIAAHVADLSNGIDEAWEIDNKISKTRAISHSCFSDGSPCVRCSAVCPLKFELQ